MLFRLKEKLKELRGRADELHAAIIEVDVKRAGADKLPRPLRPRVAKLAGDVESIEKENGELKTKLAEESPTFPWVLEKNGGDLAQLRERLSGRDAETGEYVQILADDVVGRYDRLIQALDEEVKRRQQAAEEEKKEEEQGEQEGGQGGQQRQALVPPVAELLLLKRLEEDVQGDVRVLRAESREANDPDLLETRMRLLERLGHRHAELTEMFEELVGRAGAGEEGEAGDAAPDGEQPEGEGDGAKKDDAKKDGEGEKR
jgi:hypothetical protein